MIQINVNFSADNSQFKNLSRYIQDTKKKMHWAEHPAFSRCWKCVRTKKSHGDVCPKYSPTLSSSNVNYLNWHLKRVILSIPSPNLFWSFHLFLYLQIKTSSIWEPNWKAWKISSENSYMQNTSVCLLKLHEKLISQISFSWENSKTTVRHANTFNSLLYNSKKDELGNKGRPKILTGWKVHLNYAYQSICYVSHILRNF